MDDDLPPPEGPGLFGDPPAGDPRGAGYLVLARKYRPRRFEDLIGQEAMVRTLANAFALGRIAHATMLTGVRGVGKTTTARLLARALNYRSDDRDAPSVQLDPPGMHCAAIMASSHPDVHEMDAASRTGINDIRELLDGVRYAPSMARHKVYIIDEVHMLSTQAFNGLLKTLEEPPPHVKFIFATTEIRKVPVTVLSRCQRFDLKRIPPDLLAEHLAAICAKEGVAVAPEGLALIARAAEGSVRDGLSLLDQALVQKAGDASPVTAAEIRDMLGLADRSRVLHLLEAVADGAAKTALIEVRAQYDSGADPALIARDLLDAAHEAARVQALGADARLPQAEDWRARIEALAARVSPGQLSRLWSMLLKALEETNRAPEPIAALEMALVRLCAAAALPPPEEAARLLRAGPEADGPTASAPPAETTGEGRARGALATFADVIALVASERRVDFEIDLERYVRLSSFAPGRIVFEPAPGMPADLPGKLMRLLKEHTGQAWEVRADAALGAGVESLAERRARERARERQETLAHPFVAETLRAFPGAAVTDIRTPAPPGKPGGAEVAALPTPPAPDRRKKEGDR